MVYVLASRTIERTEPMMASMVAMKLKTLTLSSSQISRRLGLWIFLYIHTGNKTVAGLQCTVVQKEITPCGQPACTASCMFRFMVASVCHAQAGTPFRQLHPADRRRRTNAQDPAISRGAPPANSPKAQRANQPNNVAEERQGAGHKANCHHIGRPAPESHKPIQLGRLR